jgi:predicted aspartyl protease
MSRSRARQITYLFYEQFKGNRPHCLNLAVVNGTHRSPVFSNALVDTGADHSILPAQVAINAGLPLPPQRKFPTLAGSVMVHQVNKCPLEIEGKVVTVSVLFDPTGLLPPILGRDALLARCEFGFAASEWRWD